VRQKVLLTALALWIAGGTVLGGLLMMRHTVALPAPATDDPALIAALRAAFPPSGDRLRAVHALYRPCPCSRRLLDHLLERRARADVDELVIVTDDDGRPGAADAALRAAGFRVLVTTPRELHERFAIEAAPMLVVARPGGELAYVGGYNRRKQSPRYEDTAILDELARRPAAAPRPVFGCPTSARLADALDPLGLLATKGIAR
jgi:hypothetical protein